jgi:non-canonical poly(A) RNA polymerase PAPD5/7
LKDVTDHIRKTLKGYNVENFGSYENGLATRTSDIDVRIIKTADPVETAPSWMPVDPAPLPPTWKTRKDNLKSLKTLQEYFRDQPGYVFCNLRYARYPLLHMQHSPSGIDIQIVGANDTSAQRDWIAQQLKSHSSAYDLFIALKATLELRGLTDVFRGGLGSYSLFVMVIGTLRYHSLRDRGDKTKKSKSDFDRAREVGLLFQTMLKIYTHELNTYKMAVQIQPFKFRSKLSLYQYEKTLEIVSTA